MRASDAAWIAHFANTHLHCARGELRVSRGHPFAVAVADPAGEPIAGATVQAGHWNGADWLGSAAEHSGADGRATVQAPAGPLYVEVTKAGFTAQMIDDARTLVPQAQAPLAVVLRPAGVITGLVHHGDEPVKRFTLAAWNDSRSYVRERVLEDAEGAFQLADVPRGESIHLLAYSDALPQSETAVVVLGDEPCEVELELPTPRKARGRVLDVLARHGAHGTFFVVGKSVAEQPEVIARMVESGHAVGHHSWNHWSFPRLSEPERLHQFLMTSTALGSMVSTPFLFRPPFGEQSVASLQTARSLGYTVVTWDVVQSIARRTFFDNVSCQERMRVVHGI